MWSSKTSLILFTFLTFSSYSSAQCPYQFMPYNDSNCYFMKYHLVGYDTAKSICTYLNASMYVPDQDTDYQQIGYWIRQYTLVNPWIGIRQVIYNYTHALGYWINDNTGENLTYSLWDYSLKTDPDYMLNFWKINSGFDRAWVKRIDARDGTESGFDLDYEGLEPSGINPIYGGSHDNWYMWPNKSIHGEQMIYFNSRMKNHRNFWMGGDNNFEMSGRGMEPWDTTGYVNAGMENYGTNPQMRHPGGSARTITHHLLATKCAIEVSRSLWPFSWFPSDCIHRYPYVCVRPQEDRFKYY